MNSRERVLAAVNFERPDRVPIDLGGLRASGINAVVYDELKRRLKLDGSTKVQDTMQILAEIEPAVLERLHIDVVPLDVGCAAWAEMGAEQGVRRQLFCGQEVVFRPDADIVVEADGGWALRNAAGDVFARMPEGGYYFDFVKPTMANHQIDPDAFRPAHTVSDEELGVVRRYADHLYRNTDKAVLGWGASISLLGLSYLLGDNITQGNLEGWYCMLLAEKETAHEMMGRFVDASIARLKLYHEAVGDRCFAWGVASDDAGTQRSEVLAPELFREMIAPHYRRLCEWVHANTNWKTFLHSCGSIYHYIEDWIDAGIDILNPVQISAANMGPEQLMERYGGRIVFWGGGCDTQGVLGTARPGEVAAHVKENLKAFKAEQGGYVFTQVHNIQQNVPAANVQAMLEAAYEFSAS